MRNYRKERVSKTERDSLTRMYHALYSNHEGTTLATKANTPAKNAPVQSERIGYTDRAGNDVVKQVTNFEDTQTYQENSGLWPELFQLNQDDIKGRNIILLETVWLKKGPYTPYFACHALTDGWFLPDGGQEFTFLSSGQVVNEWIGKLSAIDPATGKALTGKTSALPVRMRIVEVHGGDYGAYFNVVPPAQELEPAE